MLRWGLQKFHRFRIPGTSTVSPFSRVPLPPLRLPASGSAVRITVSKAGFKDRTVSVTPKADKLTRVKVKLSR